MCLVVGLDKDAVEKHCVTPRVYLDLICQTSTSRLVEVCFLCFGSTPRPVTVDKQSIHFYEGANTNLHFPLLQGGEFTQLMLIRI